MTEEVKVEEAVQPEVVVVSLGLMNAIAQYLATTQVFEKVEHLMGAIRAEVGPQLPPPPTE